MNGSAGRTCAWPDSTCAFIHGTDARQHWISRRSCLCRGVEFELLQPQPSAQVPGPELLVPGAGAATAPAVGLHRPRARVKPPLLLAASLHLHRPLPFRALRIGQGQPAGRSHTQVPSLLPPWQRATGTGRTGRTA
jgi:hypothetical protein